MREKLMSIGDDYWIEDGDGNNAFRVTARQFASARHSFSRIPRETRSPRSRSES